MQESAKISAHGKSHIFYDFYVTVCCQLLSLYPIYLYTGMTGNGGK